LRFQLFSCSHQILQEKTIAMKYLLIPSLMLITYFLPAQSIVGKWKSVDDETGKERSVVEIYEREGKYFGKILSIFTAEGEDPDPVCDECDESDPRYMTKVIGMEIIQDMELTKDGSTYEEGTILDPENGSVYDCKLWVEEGKLRVRGYIMFLYRTQTWLPFDS
jgi:uncharacterized protein (DUF2147 family)